MYCMYVCISSRSGMHPGLCHPASTPDAGADPPTSVPARPSQVTEPPDVIQRITHDGATECIDPFRS
jgi:hypothetical protein